VPFLFHKGDRVGVAGSATNYFCETKTLHFVKISVKDILYRYIWVFQKPIIPEKTRRLVNGIKQFEE
jgi:hypothetical protein